MGFSYWLDVISTFVLTITLIVLIKYTYETCKLRRQSEEQTELSIRPLIILKSIKDIPGQFAFKNLGNGPAFNIKVSEIKAWGSDEAYLAYKCKCSVIKVIDSHEEIGPLRWDIVDDNYIRESNILPPDLTFPNYADDFIRIKYSNIIGRGYISIEKIENGQIYFMETRQMKSLPKSKNMRMKKINQLTKPV